MGGQEDKAQQYEKTNQTVYSFKWTKYTQPTKVLPNNNFNFIVTYKVAINPLFSN